MSIRRSRKWLAYLLAVALLFFAASAVLSRVIQSRGAQRMLTARLAQAFGRPVEAGYFDIQWLPSPAIVAHQVTIGEDPRFGQEYFLRADSVAASPRWRSLFAGRVELGTIELSQPSLNLVRNADGRWNVESWLPPPKTSATAVASNGPRSSRVGDRLSRIEIDGGRINFGRGIDRRPFALVEVEGSIEQEIPGRWRISLEARPLRATVHLEDAGTLRVTGLIAGTSARLQPAELALTWSDASLADALRLALGNDPGVRGGLELHVDAHTEPATGDATSTPVRWELAASARVDGLHRWDMPARSDNPAINVLAKGGWQSGAPRFDLRDLRIEGPNSNVTGMGTVDWTQGFNPDLHLTSPGIALDDLFSWYRTFQPGADDGLTAEGFLNGNAESHGWPPKLMQGRLDSAGAMFKLNGDRLVASNAIHVRMGASGIELLPVTLTFGRGAMDEALDDSPTPVVGSGEMLTLEARLNSPPAIVKKKESTARWTFQLGLSGEFAHFERLLAAAKKFGRPLSAGWTAEGGMSGELHWQGSLGDRFPRPAGELASRGLLLRLPLLNQPMEIEDAKIELKPDERRVTIAKASVLGARWQGTIARREVVSPSSAPPEWEFDLVADRLDIIELDKWLGPRARPGWLARLFSAQSASQSRSSSSMGMLAQLRAHGTLHADSFALAALEFQNVQAQVELQGRTVNVTQFDAKLNGGSIGGNLRARLEADPSYMLHATVTNVSAADLAVASAALRGRLSGQISGEVLLALHGIGREDLMDSLKGEGRISAARAGIHGFDLSAQPSETSQLNDARIDTDKQFSALNAEFSIAARKIMLDKISVLDGKELFEGSGTVDFARALRIDLWPRPQAGGGRQLGRRLTGTGSTDRLFRVTGSLEAPHVSFEPARDSASQPARAPSRH